MNGLSKDKLLFCFSSWSCLGITLYPLFPMAVQNCGNRPTLWSYSIAIGRTPLDEWWAPRRELWQHTTLPRERHLCCRWDSNPQSQSVGCRRPTPSTARPLESALYLLCHGLLALHCNTARTCCCQSVLCLVCTHSHKHASCNLSCVFGQAWCSRHQYTAHLLDAEWLTHRPHTNASCALWGWLVGRPRHCVLKSSRLQDDDVASDATRTDALAAALCVSEWTDIRYNTFKKMDRLVI